MTTGATLKTREGMSVVKLLMPYVGKHRVQLALGIAGTVVGALVAFLIGMAIKYIIDGMPTDAKEGYEYLNNVLAIALAGIVLQMAVTFITGYSLVKVTARVTRDIRCDVFSSLIGRRVPYLERHSSGELQTRIIADTSIVGGFSTQNVPKIVTASISVVAGTVGDMFISVWLTLIVLAFMPLVFLPIWMWGRRLHAFGAQIQQRTAELGKATGEIFRSVKVVHAYSKEAQENSRIRQLADAIATIMVRASGLQLILTTSVSLMATIALIFLLWMAAKGIYSGGLTVGELVSFAYFNSLIVQSAGAFFGFAASLEQTAGASQRIMEYLTAEDRPPPQIGMMPAIRGEVEFRDVHFRYPARPQVDVLKGISFVIEAGANVAIVGPSGAGKSAIFELLLGLYSPDVGAILIDGTDSHEYARGQLLASVGYVPQKETLLSGTVFDNIAYGARVADEPTVIEAAKLACAHEFILQLPQGYQTDLGEVAARLSGGERQRISLARALIRKPKILLLDEDRSALDADSERRVSESVSHWAASHGVTVISIAHRLASISSADRILVLESGSIVGSGSHTDLLKGCEIYRNLVAGHSGGTGRSMYDERVHGIAAVGG